MALIMYSSCRKVHLLFLVMFLSSAAVVVLCASPDSNQQQKMIGGRRRVLELDTDLDAEVEKPKKMKTIVSSLSSKNQTKLIKSNLSLKNQTKLVKPNLSSKNQTKLAKPTNSTKPIKTSGESISNLDLKKQLKLNSTSLSPTSTSKSKSKSTNSTEKPSDLLKLGSPKNKTTKPTSTKQPSSQVPVLEKPTSQKKQPSWIEDDEDEDEDSVFGFRDLPNRFQKTLIPDLEMISQASKKYLTAANKEMTKGFKPVVGNKYAPTIASFVSLAFIIIPLLLVSLLFNHIKTYFSLQKVLVFIQVYLSIYFSILSLSALVTGLEPLKFFFATSKSTYTCLMVLQTLGYVIYLLLLIMYLVLVFATGCGLGPKMLGLGQTLVGFAVGLHFYVAVFHRVVLHQPPRTNWKVHGVYATCFLVICLLANAERRKKAYMEDGGEEGKKN